jgi:hypothetical protein
VVLGLTFRKSIKIGSGTRLNLSSSGIGVSTGVKGFRISTGPRGTYVTIGGHGIYYREKIAGPYGVLQNPDTYNNIKTSGEEQITPSTDALQLVSSDAALTLANINETVNFPSSWPWTVFLVLLPLLVVSAAILLALFPQNFPSIFVAACVSAIILAGVTLNTSAQQDAVKRIYSMTYELDNSAQIRYQAILDAVAVLNQNNRIRCVVSSFNTPDTKYNAGADSFDRTLNASCGSTQLPFITTNITPISLDLGNGNQKLYFLPDRIYVYQKSEKSKHEYGAVEYNDLSFNFYTQKEAMDPLVAPTDSEILGKTYEKVNKDGSRDKRFSYNRELTICRVGRIEITSPQGLNTILEVSMASTAQEFVEAFQNLFSNISSPDRTNTSTTQNAVAHLNASALVTQPEQDHLLPTAPNSTSPNPAVPVDGGYLPCPQCGFLNTPLDERCTHCHAQLSNVFEDNRTRTQSPSNKKEQVPEEESVRQETVPQHAQIEKKEEASMDTESTESRLLTSLVSQDRLERLVAAMGLCATKETKFIISVLSIIDKITWDEVDELVGSLRLFGPPLVPYLIPLLPDSKKSTAACAMRTLGYLGGDEAAKALVQQLTLLPTKSEPTEALVIMGEQAVPFLLPLLTDHKADVREMAVFALGKIGDANSLTLLEEMATADKSGKVWETSAHAVRWIRAEERCGIDLRHTFGAIELGPHHKEEQQ